MGTALYSAGKKNGADTIQLAWDKDKAAIQKAADEAVAEATKAKEDAIAANEVIKDDYEAQLLTSRALSSQLSQRLRIAESSLTAGSGTVSQGPDKPGTATAGSTPSMGQLNDALSSALTECANNRAQLNSLIAEIRPQL